MTIEQAKIFLITKINKINKISHDSLIQKAFVIFNFVDSFFGSFGEYHVYLIGKVNL